MKIKIVLIYSDNNKLNGNMYKSNNIDYDSTIVGEVTIAGKGNLNNKESNSSTDEVFI